MRNLLYIAVASILYSCANDDGTTRRTTRSASCDESCDTIDTVEVEEEVRTDYYDSILEKWVCVHEGTLEEIIESHDVNPDSIDKVIKGWVFLKLKK